MRKHAVTLGLYDCPVTKSDRFSVYDCRIGGFPIFPIDGYDKILESLCCSICGCKMYFLLQIYCPTEEKERFIYVFCCNKFKCSLNGEKGWKIVKISLDFCKGITNTEELAPITFDKEVSLNELNDLFDKKLQTVKQVPSTPIDLPSFQCSSYPNQYEGHFIYVKEETKEKKESSSEFANVPISNGQDNELDNFFDNFSSVSQIPEEYKKFQKIIAKNPTQLLRYDINGEPLKVIPPRSDVVTNDLVCSCGKKKRFECQLISTIISVLNCESSIYTGVENDSLTESYGMDWDSVKIYTCPDDCSSISFESCIVDKL